MEEMIKDNDFVKEKDSSLILYHIQYKSLAFLISLLFRSRIISDEHILNGQNVKLFEYRQKLLKIKSLHEQKL